MSANIQGEISRDIPPDIPARLPEDSIPLFTAYDGVLFERDTGKSFVYTAVNLTTGRSEIISRRANAVTTSGIIAMADKLRRSSVAGAGRLEAHRPFGEAISITSCHEMLTVVFNEILPQHGYAVRTEQIAFAETLLDAISHRSILLAEAGVGIGKTIAYIIGAVIAKRGRLGDYWNMGLYADTPYMELAHMPILVATSSIALQKALATTIPELSGILLEHDIIRTPLTFVIRKGREHYVCGRNLRAHIPFEYDDDMKNILTELLEPNAEIDLAEIEGLTPHIKRIISVPSRCRIDCPYIENCPYLFFRERAWSSEIDFQICNHNYLLADTALRDKKLPPLIPNYQMLIIDEAHKFFETARSMHRLELSSLTSQKIWEHLTALNLGHGTTKKLVYDAAKKLSRESRRLFRELSKNASIDGEDARRGRYAVHIGKDEARHLRNIRDIASELYKLLISEPVIHAGGQRKARVICDLAQIGEQATALAHHNSYIYCLETGDIESRLCAVPKDIGSLLYDTLWSRGVPAILTSGTLSASCDFSRIKSKLGLVRTGVRLREISLSSPFDYYNNCLLYISKNIPFPDPRDKDYINAITDEIERLIIASHGHAAVLFTSYNVMGRVFMSLRKSLLPYPMFRLDKGGVLEIERFKQSGNGVLFASGALWEGIDIPGDALSLLIIAKLPFMQPDFISEYERSLYDDINAYKERVIKPEMLIKTKQAHGRLIRTETDAGAVAILDCRVSEGGAYRDYILDALPYSRVTSDMRVLENFFRAVKPPEYFNNVNGGQNANER